MRFWCTDDDLRSVVRRIEGLHSIKNFFIGSRDIVIRNFKQMSNVYCPLENIDKTFRLYNNKASSISTFFRYF